MGEVVVKGPFGHPKSAGQGLDRESFGSCLFKQGEPFFEPSASADLGHDWFRPLLDMFLLLRAYHMVWYVCKGRTLFSSSLLLCHAACRFLPWISSLRNPWDIVAGESNKIDQKQHEE